MPPVPGYLGKVGNAELVRGISDALTIERIATAQTPTRRTFEDVITGVTRAADAYYWLGSDEVALLEPLQGLKRAAELIIDEFEKVQALQRRAAEAVREAESLQAEVLRTVRPENLGDRRGLHVRAGSACAPSAGT